MESDWIQEQTSRFYLTQDGCEETAHSSVNEPSLASQLNGEKRIANRPGISFNSNLDNWSARTAKENNFGPLKASSIGSGDRRAKTEPPKTGQTQ